MTRPAMRSLTGAFGFTTEFRDELLALEEQLGERARSRSQAPPSIEPAGAGERPEAEEEPPGQQAGPELPPTTKTGRSGTYAVGTAPRDEDAEEEPATVDLKRQRRASSAG